MTLRDFSERAVEVAGATARVVVYVASLLVRGLAGVLGVVLAIARGSSSMKE